MTLPIQLTINGVARQHSVEPRTLLVHFLRETCSLTGTHVGCETGICGACTVLVDGQAVKSCTMLAVQADGATITTIEGLAKDGKLHAVQQGFWECHGAQCGFCTPGMIMTAVQLLERNPKPTRSEIAQGLRGNLCRCTGYSHIIDAVEFASKKSAPEESESSTLRQAQGRPEQSRGTSAAGRASGGGAPRAGKKG